MINFTQSNHTKILSENSLVLQRQYIKKDNN